MPGTTAAVRIKIWVAFAVGLMPPALAAAAPFRENDAVVHDIVVDEMLSMELSRRDCDDARDAE